MQTLSNEIKLRERLLVEKCLQTIILDFETKAENKEYFRIAVIDLKLDFLSFLTTNEIDEVNYGIEFLTRNEYKFREALAYLKPMILEYQTFGLQGALQCKPIPQQIVEQPQPKSFWDKLKFWRDNV